MTVGSYRRIMITGASGAIGRALACHYAKPDVTLMLFGRNAQTLAETVKACQERGAAVEPFILDFADSDGVQHWVRSIHDEAVPDLLIVNAGQNHPVYESGRDEDPAASQELMAVNLTSAMLLVQGIVPWMRRRGSGQIALISSLAAWRGLPVTPSYSASKAGLKAFGEALRGALAPDGIQVSVVLPGYVQSPMCDLMTGPKPFLRTPDQAAIRIAKGLTANQGRIAFPFWLSLGTQWLSVLPDSAALWVLKRLGYMPLPPKTPKASR